MFDDIRPADGQRLDGRPQSRRSTDERPVFDREVPLQQQPATRVLSPAIHAWLDGELPEAAVRTAETQRDLEFWSRLNREAQSRRHMRTPTHIQQSIMAAIPASAPQLITPWYRREFVLTPAVAVGVGAALVALSVAITALAMVLVQR